MVGRREKTASVAFLLSLALCTALAQDPHGRTGAPQAIAPFDTRAGGRYRSLTDDDRLSVIVAALDAKTQSGEPDCSHLVHAIYEQAGFRYLYAPSSELYAGVAAFQRVKKPEPGDLVVWPGHVGIVIKPSQHIFFSDLSTGPGIDDYTTSYWRHRGKPRFYRYVKSGIGPPRALPQLVRTNRKHHAASDTDDAE